MHSLDRRFIIPCASHHTTWELKNSRTTLPLPETNLPTRGLIATAFRRLSPDNLKVIPYTGLTLFFLCKM